MTMPWALGTYSRSKQSSMRSSPIGRPPSSGASPTGTLITRDGSPLFPPPSPPPFAGRPGIETIHPIKPRFPCNHPRLSQGGNTAVSPDDTKGAPEAPLLKQIAELAESLAWNPVSIYEWVKNNIETEWYWGCIKGD